MSHRQNANHTAIVGNVDSQMVDAEVEVAHEGAVREHHSLGEPCGAAGIVDHCQLLGLVDMVLDVLCMEVFRKLHAEHGIEVLSCVCELL